MLRLGLRLGILWLAVISSVAQEMAPPVPQRLDIHSSVLNEDRVVWVRLPPGYTQSKSAYPVLYQTDAPENVNEIGSTIDFLVENERMSPVIVVGIANTDRVRDLTPTRADYRERDGTITPYPNSGGADRFLDFIQNELIPAIEKRYRTAPYRIFSGHSLGGLLAVHALITRPNLFQAYLAVSPALQWDDSKTLHQAEQFLRSRSELRKTLFLSLAHESGTMEEDFEGLHRLLTASAPKGLRWEAERFPDEDHSSTVLPAHYAGLRLIYDGWQVPRDEKTGLRGGGLKGIEEHYRKLSERFGYPIPVPESAMNGLGYQLLGKKKLPEAIEVFRRNVELYPESANVYDSLGEGLEAAGKLREATQNFQKAMQIATATNDGQLPQFKKHLERATAEAKTAGTSH